jgi:hypothetical protein
MLYFSKLSLISDPTYTSSTELGNSLRGILGY